MGKYIFFFNPNFAYSKVAAKESESAEDSLLKVEIMRITSKIIKFKAESFSKYFRRKKKKSKRKK